MQVGEGGAVGRAQVRGERLRTTGRIHSDQPFYDLPGHQSPEALRCNVMFANNMPGPLCGSSCSLLSTPPGVSFTVETDICH